MKKTFAWTALILTAFLAGCVSTQTTSAQALLEEPAKNQEGGAVDYSFFDVTVEEGWDTMDMIGGVQIYKQTGEMLQIQVDGEGVAEGEDVPFLESVNQNFNGLGVRQTELLGRSFHAVSYMASGVKQCMYTSVIGGKLVKIQATGEAYGDVPDIKKMVESIIFKING